MCVEIRSINSRLWFMAVSWLWCPRRMTTSASIAGNWGEGSGERGKSRIWNSGLTVPSRIAHTPPHWLLPFRFTDYRACRMHFECASFDLNSCTLCYNIYGTHKIRKYAKNKRNYTRQAGGVASYGGFIASLPQLMRYNYIYVYGSTQYINIFHRAIEYS